MAFTELGPKTQSLHFSLGIKSTLPDSRFNHSYGIGLPFTLMCKSNSSNPSIKKNFGDCTWSRNGDEYQWCFEKDENGGKTPCDPNYDDKRVAFDSRDDECRINIKSSELDDSGNWTCELTDPSGYGAVATESIFVEVS